MKKIVLTVLSVCLSIVGAVADNVSFKVSNMRCENCAGRVEKTLKANGAVSNVKVDLENKIVTVTFDEANTTADVLLAALTDAKFQAEAVKHCANCQAKTDDGEEQLSCANDGSGQSGCCKTGENETK